MNKTIILTDEQEHGVSKCVETSNTRTGIYRMGGAAGTGKTVSVKSIIKKSPGAIACSLTGKAVDRMKETGVTGAATTHSIIYRYDKYTEKFYLRDSVDGKYFLIDEGSMIGGRLWVDIQSFHKPIIVIGDPAQLQPVADDDPGLMIDPDYVLTEVHRQALLSGIVQMATDVRVGNPIQSEYSDVTIRIGRRAARPTDEDIRTHDIILCGRNRERIALNSRARKLLGMDGNRISPGEKIICLKNDAPQGMYNGKCVTVDSASPIPSKKAHLVKCYDYSGKMFVLTVADSQFNQPKPVNIRRARKDLVYMDYAYAITVHKSQGSEWDRVLVMDDDGEFYDYVNQEPVHLWEPARWRYTAITRAAKQLTMLFRDDPNN